MSDRRIDDFAVLEDAQDDDLVLVSSENETYTMKVKTLKDAVKADSDRAVTSANQAVAAANQAVTDAAQAKTDAAQAVADAAAAQEATEAAAASALAAENSSTAAKTASQQAAAVAATARDDVDGLTPRVENLEKKINDVSIDPDDLGLEQDTDTGYVYPTYRGVRSENGIPLAATGGTGSGGLTYTVTLKNALASRALTVADGQPAELKCTYSSVDEEGYDDGAGVGTVTIDGVKVLTFSAVQGSNTVDIAKYLTAGEHNVKLRVENSEGTGRSISYTVTLVSLSLSTTLDALATYSGDVTFYYTPVGTGEKTIYFYMDGVKIGSEIVSASGRSRSWVIPVQDHGGHIFEAYAELMVGTELIRSNIITLGMMWVEADNLASSIVSPFHITEAKQGEALAIDYLAYDPTTESAAVTLAVLNPDGSVYSSLSLTVDRNPQTWTVSDYPVGSVTFRLAVGNEVIDKVVEVSDSGVVIERITDSLALDFDAKGRSNQEADPAVWTDGTTEATFSNVAFAGADGWLTDADGSPMLRLLPGSEMTLPFALFASDCRTNGATVEVEMATNNVRDYDSVVMSCLSGGRGFKIASQYAQLKSEGSEISMQFKEEQRVRVTFVVSPKNLQRLIYVYIDGIMCGAVQYPENDDFSQNPAAGITIGAESSGIDIYRIALYTKGLDRQEVLTNFIYDRPTLNDRINSKRKNDVLDVSDNIVITKLPAGLPYMVISCAELPQFKGNNKTCEITYVDPANALKSFTAAGVDLNVQGTSSAGYKKKNFLIKLLNGLTMTSDGSTAETYALRDNSIPVSTFCLKADVASSDNANNVELVRLYNRTCPYRHPAMAADSRVRYGIDGKPIVVFWHNTATGETTFWGKYNFNNDKSTPEVFGWGEGYECWEIKNNTSDRVVFKRSDYGDGWDDDFEAVYPKDHTDVTHLKALTDWLVSTDRDAVNTEAEKTVRLNKFRNEFENYFVKDAMLYYYLFTETFLMVDNRAKNFFPVYDPNIRRWYPFPYDMDTALGINNEGELVFDYDLEDTDQVGGYDVYNAQNSVLWCNIRDAFPSELAAMYVELRNTSEADGTVPYSYEAVEKEFTNHQSVWPEAVWNEDAYEKYLRWLFEGNDASYLGMLQGPKGSQRDWWMFNGFRYRDSKYKAGDANTNFITLRLYTLGDITVTPYSHIWPRIKYGSYTETARGKRNEATTLKNPNDKLNDTETYIYSADRIADIGDLSPLQVGYADFTAARKLQKLKLGDGAEGYENTKLTVLYVGNNDLLTELDVQNCTGLTMTVDLSACDSLETVKAKGSSVTGFTLPVGGHVKTLELPGTITNFTIQSQKMLDSVTFEGYEALSTIRVENTPNVDIETLVNSAGALNRVRLVDVEWEAESAETLLETVSKLNGCIGLDAAGNNTARAVVQGKVYVDAITDEQLFQVNDLFPDLLVVSDGSAMCIIRYVNYDNTLLYRYAAAVGADAIDPVANGLIEAPTRESTDGAGYEYSGWGELPTDIQGNVSIVAQYVGLFAVWFYDEDGTNLLHTQWVQSGLTCPDPVAEGYINAPVKESTAQYSYAFTGWDKALTKITAPRTVLATYEATVRTYTVRFYNVTTLLETVGNVPYGSNATYSGDAPVKEDTDKPADYEFIGWSPSNKGITGDTDCYALYRYNGLISRALVEKTIEGGYVNESVEAVGDYAFHKAVALTDVEFTKVASIGEYAFSGCSALESIDFPVATSVGANAFRGCTGLKDINLPVATSIVNYAFYGCTSLVNVELPACSGGSNLYYAFQNCTALQSVNLPEETSLGQYAFDGCVSLKNVYVPKVEYLSGNVFRKCTALESIELPAVTSIGAGAFTNCSKLTALTLSNTETVCNLQYSGAFTGTPIADGTGYIYVPAALVESYKAATNWSAYAEQIKAIGT